MDKSSGTIDFDSCSEKVLRRIQVIQLINGIWQEVFLGPEMDTSNPQFNEDAQIRQVMNLLRSEAAMLFSSDGNASLVCKSHGPIRMKFIDSKNSKAQFFDNSQDVMVSNLKKSLDSEQGFKVTYPDLSCLTIMKPRDYSDEIENQIDVLMKTVNWGHKGRPKKSDISRLRKQFREQVLSKAGL